VSWCPLCDSDGAHPMAGQVVAHDSMAVNPKLILLPTVVYPQAPAPAGSSTVTAAHLALVASPPRIHTPEPALTLTPLALPRGTLLHGLWLDAAQRGDGVREP